MTLRAEPAGLVAPAITRRSVAWLVVFLLPFAGLAVHQWHWDPPSGSGDYAQYLLQAKAIVEGRASTSTGYIFHPDAWSIGPADYPPGWPLTLAPLVALVGVHSPWFRVLTLVITAAMAVLAWRRLLMDVTPWQAAAGAGFAALALEAARGTLLPISDPGFAALLWAMVYAVDTTKNWTWSRIVLVTALGGAATAFRLVGVALLGGFGLYALATWRRHHGRAAIPVVMWGAIGVVALAIGAVHLYDGPNFLVGVTGMASRLSVYRGALFGAALYPSAIAGINTAYHIVSSVLIGVGLVVLTGRIWRSYLGAACLAYLGLLFTVSLAEPRYAWPLYPVAAAALAVGLTTVLERLRRWIPSLPAATIALAMVAGVGIAAFRAELRHGPPPSLVGTADARALFDWIRRANSATPMRMAFFNPRVLALETGVSAMGHVRRSAPGHLLAYAEVGITHLITQSDDQSDCPQRLANTLPATFPERFRLVYENPGFRVYRVLPATSPADTGYRRLRWEEFEQC